METQDVVVNIKCLFYRPEECSSTKYDKQCALIHTVTEQKIGKCCFNFLLISFTKLIIHALLDNNNVEWRVDG